MNKFIIVSGPACSGKNTLINRILKESGDLFEETVSCTTRAPRERENHGEHYHFISKEEFREKIENEELLEWAVVHGDIYFGTPKSEVERISAKGKTPILIIDVQGALNLKEKFPEAKTVFIKPENIGVIRERLERRGYHDAKDLQNRLESAEKEMALASEYDYVVENKNGSIREAVNGLKNILKNIQ